MHLLAWIMGVSGVFATPLAIASVVSWHRQRKRTKNRKRPKSRDLSGGV